LTDLLRLPPKPVFDPAADGNPFDWIVRTAPKARAEAQAAMELHRIRLQVARRCAMPPLVTRADAK